MTSYIELPASGLDASFSEMEQFIQDTAHRFAAEVLRPLSAQMDEMTPE